MNRNNQMENETWTITFAEAVRNYEGMQIIGNKAKNGFTNEDLIQIEQKCKNAGYVTELIDLKTDLPEKYSAEFSNKIPDKNVYVLVIRNGIEMLLKDNKKDIQDFHKELFTMKNLVDRKAVMHQSVKNIHMRYNLCYSTTAQEPDYENKKGRIVAFNTVEYLNKIRDNLPLFFGDKATNLNAQLNYYYDIKKCGISGHGDSIRRKVIGLRIGASMPLYFQWWYYRSNIFSKIITIPLHNNDVYIMSEKAVGTDWKSYTFPTLRHATGADKYKF